MGKCGSCISLPLCPMSVSYFILHFWMCRIGYVALVGAFGREHLEGPQAPQNRDEAGSVKADMRCWDLVCPRGTVTSLPHSNLSLSSSKQDWLPWLLLLLSLTYETRAFYVPGVAPINFHQNDPVEIKVSAFLDFWSLCWAFWPEDPRPWVTSLLWLQRTKT